jgi:hypothetical protein
LFYAGQAISLIGTWIQQIALSWLVYRTTGSGFLLGLVTFCSQIPMLIFVPLAGLLSDRYDRHKLMIAVRIGGSPGIDAGRADAHRSDPHVADPAAGIPVRRDHGSRNAGAAVADQPDGECTR